MASTVNSTITITRDGIATSTPLKDLSYAKLVALEVSLAGALSQLCTQGVLRLDSPGPSASGEADVKFELVTDHGAGGSEFIVGYSGISAQAADAITLALRTAANAVILAK
jgi:hypothetical protein